MMDSVPRNKQEDANKNSNSWLQNLRSEGFEALESINFVNLRVLHISPHDGERVGRRIIALNPKPDIIALELFGHSKQDVIRAQEYVLGLVDEVTPGLRHPFMKSLLDVLREDHASNNYSPVICCTDIELSEESGPDFEKDYFVNDYFSERFFLRDTPKTARAKLMEMVDKIAALHKKREIQAIFRLKSEIVARIPKNKKEITIAAPWGAAHGGLNVEIRKVGARTSSYVEAPFFSPFDVVIRHVMYGQTVTEHFLDTALVSFLIGESILDLERSDRIKVMYGRKEVSRLWKVTRKMHSKFGIQKIFDIAKSDKNEFDKIVESTCLDE